MIFMVEFSALGPISGIPDSDMDTVQPNKSKRFPAFVIQPKSVAD